MGWKTRLYQLTRGQRLIGARVKHNLPFVAVSNMAEQYYCEQKVENRYLTQPLPRLRKQEGSDLHEIILGARMTTEEIISRIETFPTYITSFPTEAKYRGIVIAGRPDAIVFQRGEPRFLIELKTTSGNPVKMWRSQVVQAGVYGFLLEEMGFNCSNLQLAMVRLRRNDDAKAETKREFISTIASVLVRKRTKDLERIYLGNVRCDCFPYERMSVLQELSWVLGYWLSERQPMIATNAAACSYCEFKETCSKRQ